MNLSTQGARWHKSAAAECCRAEGAAAVAGAGEGWVTQKGRTTLLWQAGELGLPGCAGLMGGGGLKGGEGEGCS